MHTARVWLTTILLAGITVLSIGILRGESSVGSYLELRESRDVLKQAVENLELRNEALKAEILKIKKSSSYAERILRDKYHITEEGERIVFFAD